MNFFLSLSVRENPDRTRLTSSSFADPLQFASLYWRPLFCLFSEATLYFLLASFFARNSPFYLCSLLLSFMFLSPYSAYFGVLCNFLARFSGLALRRLLVAFFGRSVSLYPAYFQLKPSLHELELWQFLSNLLRISKAKLFLLFWFVINVQGWKHIAFCNRFFPVRIRRLF